MTDTLTVAEVLTKAANLIEPEGAWTQCEYARDGDGTPLTNGWDKSAVCWCAIGAIEKVAGPTRGYEAISELEYTTFRDALSAVDFNDTPGRTQAEVVAKLREAAERAKGGDQ